ncbi:indolepyruvate ferredoxin oxidoreductase [Slackia heliotrinireducens]|uniref:Indolepyruvate oxidoreductase subunit IorA n=1 Tax=Slackia heliotrinireducens (strain ATCC 29202 / DSM 20476 / NCTC 11029 / RHS 1) TaxID=471855 RepID=C7N412_SLAHD|nr:thiamine pyrophosphate-dependent enzyme [Slackia heliotrinireducens]ACV23748.1 indolepyruvate ferredoxin oxidreductase, alpha/beta subunit [Slackia heliotrinireducens DSM 20476]VEH03363.1 indolepyruvate ferredoxin oxidoreductase [Slackia heliotrinireducens]
MKKLLMGNEAFACAALEAGASVIAGYPGTPSSEVIETVAKRVADGSATGVHVEWSTNEKAALEVLAGAAYSGARTLFTCKQVGLNVASDPLMSLNYVGVEGGCVLYVADDPGPISSQTEQDTRRFASFAKVPVFDPCNIEQGMDMMGEAFALSERYQMPVIFRSTTRVCHSSTFVEVEPSTQGVQAKGFTKDDSRFVIFPRRSYRAHLDIDQRLRRTAAEFSGVGQKGQPPLSQTDEEPVDLSRFNPVETVGEAPRLGIVCGGVSTAYVREALSILAQRAELPAYRLMQVGTPYPFPEQRAHEFCEGLDRIVVFEELDHVLEDEFVKLQGMRAMAGFPTVRVVGRNSGFGQVAGENTVESSYQLLVECFGLEADVPPTLADEGDAADCELPVRPPVLCAGCPHRGAFYACKQAVRKMRVKATFSGDIGCYTLGNAKPLDAVDTCLCMGAGITMAQGLSVANPEVKQLAFVGDSTFFASGMTGVANAVYNNHDITVCVLDNRITAMTGGQPHPGTGNTLMGTASEPLVIEDVLRALGVKCITFANPHHLDESIAAAREAIEFEGPSAVIFRAPCVNLIKPAAPAAITDACIGCKRCITQIGCPAIGFDGEKAVVDRSLCNGCGLCMQVCPFDAIVKEG